MQVVNRIGRATGSFDEQISAGHADLVRVEYHVKLHHQGTADAVTADHEGIAAVNRVHHHAASKNGGMILAAASDMFDYAACFHGGQTVLLGNPRYCTADQRGQQVIFGNPERITARHGSKIAVVSATAGYEPESVNVDAGQWSAVFLICPTDQAAESPPIEAYPPFRQHELLATAQDLTREIGVDTTIFQLVLNGFRVARLIGG